MTKINDLTIDWKNVKNKCRTTTNKEYTENEPTKRFKQKLLISEHSPIRLITVDWSWKQIPSWTATHWSRHIFNKWISTQRDDRTGKNRTQLSQNDPVNFDGMANAQNLIDAWRKRLCFQASPETRMLAIDFKNTLHELEPLLADVLVPNCVYRCGCPEFEQCKQRFWDKFLEDSKGYDLSDIAVRYKFYNMNEM